MRLWGRAPRCSLRSPPPPRYARSPSPRIRGEDLDELYLAEPLEQVIVRGDRLGIKVRPLGRHAFGQGLDQEIRPEMEEEGHRVARMAAPLGRRVDHAVG